MKWILRLIIIVGIIYMFYKLGQYDLLTAFADNKQQRYYSNPYNPYFKPSEWDLRYDLKYNPWGEWWFLLDVTLFIIWWGTIVYFTECVDMLP